MSDATDTPMYGSRTGVTQSDDGLSGVPFWPLDDNTALSVGAYSDTPSVRMACRVVFRDVARNLLSFSVATEFYSPDHPDSGTGMDPVYSATPDRSVPIPHGTTEFGVQIDAVDAGSWVVTPYPFRPQP